MTEQALGGSDNIRCPMLLFEMPEQGECEIGIFLKVADSQCFKRLFVPAYGIQMSQQRAFLLRKILFLLHLRKRFQSRFCFLFFFDRIVQSFLQFCLMPLELFMCKERAEIGDACVLSIYILCLCQRLNVTAYGRVHLI